MSVDTRYSNAARADLVDIWLHIAADSIAAADRQIDRIENAIARLTDFPEIGHAREDAGPGVRLLLQDSYLVLYRYREAEALVVIERIVHGRRDLTVLPV
ncbi:type II toxin-antitoxin system RelE/ParE family toxin [Porphyrobacter sp. SLTP]|uniref:type II toxin-antitoxin system RelE/ParE family toxin n=1 Tax=Porphyrobacter sp. SLTP TaxID=2683266 RepID=UPI001412A338|nr:type II toxin-antitoxin system RelE/ParE family toxin [Porphyrobacter sp. SLTP]NBB25871.1 type II toxin-antitoxin system RelE/ParE family toxin [Porphyrobacter sp. SLTP]